MQRSHLAKQGHDEKTIQEKLDLAHDSTAQNIGLSLGCSEKVWEINRQLVINWHIPQDVTRVMLFERLEYQIEERKRRNKSIEIDEQTKIQIQLIDQIKSLYPKKLELLKD